MAVGVFKKVGSALKKALPVVQKIVKGVSAGIDSDLIPVPASVKKFNRNIVRPIANLNWAGGNYQPSWGGAPPPQDTSMDFLQPALSKMNQGFNPY